MGKPITLPEAPWDKPGVVAVVADVASIPELERVVLPSFRSQRKPFVSPSVEPHNRAAPLSDQDYMGQAILMMADQMAEMRGHIKQLEYRLGCMEKARFRR